MTDADLKHLEALCETYKGTVDDYTCCNFSNTAREAVPALIAEVKRLREALEKYANRDSWVRTSFCNESHWDRQISEDEEHPSDLARAALAPKGEK